MNSTQPYEVGQRWEFQTDVPEFENTAVIAKVIEPRPEWGQTENEYEVYVRFASRVRHLLPPKRDGVVLLLKKEGLDRSAVRLVEQGVDLPWWWIYGLELDSEDEAPNSIGRMQCGHLSESLAYLFQTEKQRAEYLTSRRLALQKHQEKYRNVTVPPPSRSISESWRRIVAWLTENGQGYQLSPGASDASIAQFEETIGSPLPDDFKESLRLYDGPQIPGENGEFLSLARMEEQWSMYRDWQLEGNYADGSEDWEVRDCEGPVKPIFWSVKRIPVTDRSGDHLMLDLDPPPEGHYGQVLDHSHEVGPERVVASNWAAFLSQLAQDFVSGQFVAFEKDGIEHINAVKRTLGES